MSNITVDRMIDYYEAENLFESIGGMGGFFQLGMRWKDYINTRGEKEKAYAEAFREYVLANNLKHGGDWHQNAEAGVPLFNDGTVGMFSFRAWGDIMAAIWAEHENKDYHYMDFYMECLISESRAQ